MTEETEEDESEDTPEETEEDGSEETETDDSASSDLTDTEEEKIAVTAIEISNHEEELVIGETMTLTATVLPADATDAAVTFTSSNTGIATVNSSGEVKGISKGTVTIFASAGDVTVSTTISVIVSTTKISINQNYLVLKPGGTYQLSASVSPADAPQAITYKSLSPKVAEVSSSGLVTAEATGNTTVIVSDGDLMAAVTVIVNASFTETTEEDLAETEVEGTVQYATVVYAQEMDVISGNMLKYMYENEKVLTVVGSGYSFTIDGAQIENYANEIKTDIGLTQEPDGISFCINDGEYLCGSVTLYLEDPEGEYLYLYNESKSRYEQISTEQLDEITITSPGQYKITSEKIKESRVRIRYFVVGGVILLVGGIVLYIVLKKKYWFW
ncbi:MAG: Ig-like domain-containing protein [Clostridiales bacterium]|nr:Ig-like domain-containing protein [Clostridiales bacterium]